MRMQIRPWLVHGVCASLLALIGLLWCVGNRTSVDYSQWIVGSWRMAGPVMGHPADAVLHVMREGDYILDNRDSDRVAEFAPSGTGRWLLSRDDFELLISNVDDLRRVEPMRTVLRIVALDDKRLVTADSDFGVKIEWVRVTPLNN